MNNTTEEQKKVIIKDLKKLIKNIENNQYNEKELFDMHSLIDGWNNDIFNSLEDHLRLLFLGYYVDNIYNKVKIE